MPSIDPKDADETLYIVMGAWLVARKNGNVWHKLCKNWCRSFNNHGTNDHQCSYLNCQHVKIPPMVITASNMLRTNTKHTRHRRNYP